ncbi:hypothetical protein JKG47_04765 [Acidithiobacillus sp. MC6.1]|nr:hypothetical protein [Acidithiobacillus sp. MC6.1]
MGFFEPFADGAETGGFLFIFWVTMILSALNLEFGSIFWGGVLFFIALYMGLTRHEAKR